MEPAGDCVSHLSIICKFVPLAALGDTENPSNSAGGGSFVDTERHPERAPSVLFPAGP